MARPQPHRKHSAGLVPGHPWREHGCSIHWRQPCLLPRRAAAREAVAQERLCKPVLHHVRAAAARPGRRALAPHPQRSGRGLRRRLPPALAWPPAAGGGRGLGLPSGRGPRGRGRLLPAEALAGPGATHGPGAARAQQPRGRPGLVADHRLHGQPRLVAGPGAAPGRGLRGAGHGRGGGGAGRQGRAVPRRLLPVPHREVHAVHRGLGGHRLPRHRRVPYDTARRR
mmetsp:Transcript_36286/g.103716  ORF Transcript_36286/g.103716 Transcript_36286/m.103716 type:complete len:226 (-) Transcript_36286:647-1324(-)